MHQYVTHLDVEPDSHILRLCSDLAEYPIQLVLKEYLRLWGKRVECLRVEASNKYAYVSRINQLHWSLEHMIRNTYDS